MTSTMASLHVPSNLPILPISEQGPLFPGLVLNVELVARSSINLLRTLLRDLESSAEGKQAFVGVCPVLDRKPGAGTGVEVADDRSDKPEKALQVIKLPRDDDGQGKKLKVEDIYEWGCAARLSRIERLSSGGYVVVLEGLARFRVERFTSVGYPYFEAAVTLFPEQGAHRTGRLPKQRLETYRTGLPVQASNLVSDLKAVGFKLIDTFAMLKVALPGIVSKRIKAFLNSCNLQNAPFLADLLMATLSTQSSEKNHHLTLHVPEDRVRAAIEVLSRINEEAGATKAIGDRVEGNMSRRQREYFLRQQLEAIAQELRELEGKNGVRVKGVSTGLPSGTGNDEEDEMADYERKIETAMMPPEALTQAQRELRRLKRIPSQSVEHGVIRNYLDWLVDMPWGRGSPSTLDRDFLERARRQLDQDHHGIEKVKRRLLEYLAVLRLRSLVEIEQAPASAPVNDTSTMEVHSEADLELNAREEEARQLHETEAPTAENPVPQLGRDKGPILLLVGPPGVGKTSIARSLATAMGRKFHRISLGGVRDEAEIRGHRRTYVGAMPGNICQGLRKVGVNNPVLLLDEIDKLSSNNFHGDPSAAMLEVLDPEQNFAFNDHYINTSVDLSKVVFIATANTLDTIAAPLRDRMEIIELSGYVQDEKLAIARRYLLPKQLSANALPADQLSMTDDVVLQLIAQYTMEAGVRQLERELGSVCRAKAVEYADAKDLGRDYNPVVSAADLAELLGVAKFEPEMSDAQGRPGVATGLAYRGSGNGGILHVESTTYPGSGALHLTGNLGDVIRESANLALAWIRANAWALGLVDSSTSDVLSKRDVHIHLPAGGIPKDGPSAGVALVMSVVSLLSGKSLDVRLAMTGEITLRGLVTPVGGIKEKVISAHRAGVRKIILPYRNRKDVDADLPQLVRDEVTFVYAKTIWDALECGFGDRLWENLPPPEVHARQASRRATGGLIESRL